MTEFNDGKLKSTEVVENVAKSYVNFKKDRNREVQNQKNYFSEKSGKAAKAVR